MPPEPGDLASSFPGPVYDREDEGGLCKYKTYNPYLLTASIKNF